MQETFDLPCSTGQKVRQCDQIWQHFATLVKVYKSLAICWQFISYVAKCWAYFGKFVIFFGLIFIVANGQILKNNLTIWSNWQQSTTWPDTSLHLFLGTKELHNASSSLWGSVGTPPSRCKKTSLKVQRNCSLRFVALWVMQFLSLKKSFSCHNSFGPKRFLKPKEANKEDCSSFCAQFVDQVTRQKIMNALCHTNVLS